jgi:hypothetical protein
LPANDHSKDIRNPVSALVRDGNGEERVEALLPVGTTKEAVWVEALHAAVKGLAKEVFRRGDHGRSQRELEESIFAHLDRDAMAAALAREYLSALAREVKTHLEIDLDIRLGRVDATPSGFIQLLFVTLHISSAGRVFNCMVSIDRTGQLERLRDHTAVMRNWEWGLLLNNFICCIDRVCRKRSNIYDRVFRQLCKDKGLVRRALIDGLDQRSLKRSVYGPFPDMDRTTCTFH